VNVGGTLDRRRIRRAFSKAARTYDGAAALPREIDDRMRERLDLLRATPRRILDLGSGTGYGARALAARYAGCQVVELDAALAMLRESARHLPWWRRGLDALGSARTVRVCADLEQLPFADRTFDMIWSNLVLHWTNDPQIALTEVRRVLQPGGVFLFSTLGPDTLKELRASYAKVDGHEHVHRFIDLHDLGDMLVQARFADPVMDMEVLTLTYPDVRSLMRELKACGAGNSTSGRAWALSGKHAFAGMCAAYERYRSAGRLPASFEVVYGHAWRPEAERRSADGRAVIEFHPRDAGKVR